MSSKSTNGGQLVKLNRPLISWFFDEKEAKSNEKNRRNKHGENQI